MTAAELRPLVLSLPPEERRQLANEVWESLEAEVDDGEEPVTPAAIEEWILEELERRVELHRQNPQDVYSWEEVKRNARKSYAARKPS